MNKNYLTVRMGVISSVLKHYTSFFLGISLFASVFQAQANLHLMNNLNASGTNHTFFNLSTGKIVPLSDSATTKWDIAFKGTTILINGGTSGPGTTVAKIENSDFDQVLTATTSDYTTDSVNGKAIPTGSGNGWYTYAGSPTHKIEPILGKTIVVHTNGGDYAKIEIISYYEGNPDLTQNTTFPPTEASKHYTFRYFIQSRQSTDLDHSNSNIIVHNFNAKDGYNFFSLREAINIHDSATTNWDLAFKGSTILVNGGISGPGNIEAQVVQQSYSTLNSAPTSGYVTDSTSGKAIPTGSSNGWYTYAGPPTHKIEPITSRSIAIKTETEDYYKLEIISYYEGDPDLSQYTVFPPAESSKYYTFRFKKITAPTSASDILIAKSVGFQVYPNPSHGSIIIKNQYQLHSLLMILDMNGQIVFQEQLSGSSKQLLSVNQLVHGIYNMVIINDEQTVHQKLIIQ